MKCSHEWHTLLLLHAALMCMSKSSVSSAIKLFVTESLKKFIQILRFFNLKIFTSKNNINPLCWNSVYDEVKAQNMFCGFFGAQKRRRRRKKCSGLLKHKHLIFALYTGNQLISSKCLTASPLTLKRTTPVIYTWSVCTLFDIISVNCTGWHAAQDYFAAVLKPEGRTKFFFPLSPAFAFPLLLPWSSVSVHTNYLIRAKWNEGAKRTKNRLNCNFYWLPLLCRAVMQSH